MTLNTNMTSPKIPTYSLFYGLSCVLTLPVMAEDNDNEAMEVMTITAHKQEIASYKTGETSTSTGMDLSYLETPQSVTAVNEQAMKDQQLNSVVDVMNSVSSVYARPMDNDRYTVSARGMEVSTILYDGVPITYDTRFNYGDNLMDTAIYDRVEVVRGANGLMIGAGEPSASINLIRKRPTHDFNANVSVGTGSWNLKRGVVDISGSVNTDESIRARLVAVHQERDSYLDRYEQKRSTLYGVIEADLTTDTLLTVGTDYQYNEPKGTMAGGLPLFHSDGTRTNYSTSATTAPDWASAETTALNSFVSLEHSFNPDWVIKGTYTYGDNSLDFNYLWPKGFPDPNTNEGMVPGSINYIDGNRKINNLNLTLKGHFSLFGQDHQMIAGFNNQKMTFENTYYKGLNAQSEVGDFTDPNWSYPEPEWSREKSWESTGETKQQGIYVASHINVTDQWSFVLGGRLSDWETDMNDFGTLHKNKISNEFTSYVGTTYAITPIVAVYASYSDIFTPQNVKGKNNTYLDPIKGKNYETGIKASLLDDQLNLSLNGFNTLQDNLGIKTGDVDPNTGMPIYRGVDGTETKGFEFETNGAITDDWNLTLGYTYFKIEDPQGNRLKTDIPNKQLKLFTTYELGDVLEGLQIGGGARWYSSIYKEVSGIPNVGDTKVKQDSYAIYDVMVRYEVNKKLNVNANVKNLFDKEYYSQMGIYNQYHAGEPRNISVNVDYQF
ncbi:TonB-dependent siderophore bisucaberin receptor BitA [Aliivibrio salmonicida]|uniref:TonB-dependent iron-siderophore receptor n=1 Tax=Aliivibrio salmonicida (strain LFI1238) TaxID=316275 RepID=B6EP95_ALISL|nr:TonB-dependent siderophore bisucaberin receptor BitA [Aliivibrio salmonicida]CAQ77822.1 TonB-dependent iron-siderophore receptor precursor [Aliivibrio salmonicida LFI1238]